MFTVWSHVLCALQFSRSSKNKRLEVAADFVRH